MTTDQPPGMPGGAPGACKRPGCGRPLPPAGLGRARQFCSQDCARGYHNAARYSTAAAGPAAADGGDPLAALEILTRQAATLISQARAEAGRLDPARAAEAGAQAARQAAAGQITAASTEASGRVTAAEQAAARCQRERDAATEAARHAQHTADTEISRARQAEADARAETGHVRADAARERDAFREHYQAQARAAETLTTAERARADRAEHQLDTELAAFRALATGQAQHTTTAGRPGSRDNPEPPPRRKARPASPQP